MMTKKDDFCFYLIYFLGSETVFLISLLINGEPELHLRVFALLETMSPVAQAGL